MNALQNPLAAGMQMAIEGITPDILATNLTPPPVGTNQLAGLIQPQFPQQPQPQTLTGGAGTDTLLGAGGLGSPGMPSVGAVENYIREAAIQRNMDPDVAVRVAKSEGLGEGIWQSNVVMDGKRETSFGPFQLLVGGGLGDAFAAKHGISPENPSTVFQQVDFALDQAKEGGWAPWYGAAKVGIGTWTGINQPGKVGGDAMVARDFDPQVAAQMNIPAAGAGAGFPPAPPAPEETRAQRLARQLGAIGKGVKIPEGGGRDREPPRLAGLQPQVGGSFQPRPIEELFALLSGAPQQGGIPPLSQLIRGS